MGVVVETYGSNQKYFYKFKDQSSRSRYTYESEDKGHRGKGFVDWLKETFKSGFLPQGYPDSVSHDYLQYQIWDTVQAFCSSITGTLATQAVLKGYGVGDETATVTAASITWMLKDGAGMIGRILFAWMKGTQLDCNPKRWRLCADILNDLAIFLDLLAPIFKSYFIFIACISSVTRSIVGVAGGATRAALTLHQARRNNMADVSAKDGSQETLVGLIALITSVIVTPLVAERTLLVWSLFVLFTFFHLVANYQAVSCVIMETINLNRLFILLKHRLIHLDALTPSQVNKLEPVIRDVGIRKKINIGVTLKRVLDRHDSPQDILETIRTNKQHFVIAFDKGNINIAFHKNADDDDVLKACIQALLIDLICNQEWIKSINEKYNDDMGKLSREALKVINRIPSAEMSGFQIFAERFSDDFISELKVTKWDLSRSNLTPDEWRYSCHDKIE